MNDYFKIIHNLKLSFMRKKLKNGSLKALLCVAVLYMGGGVHDLQAEVPQEANSVVSGVVSDADGPIIGASVVEKGNPSNGTATDVDGKYSLRVSANATLAVSYLGYSAQEIAINGRTSIDVTLSEDSKALEEVVVVGYGTQKRATLTGSVVAIGSKELDATKNTNVQNMMTGKLPGVRVVQMTSEPGVFTNQFDIRGLGTPLLVVDGVPRGDLARMDPNDIESISVLKDASAAIYGVRGGSGVILITTKKGEKGKAKIEYSMYYGIQTPAERLQPINAYDRAILYNETTMRNTTSPTKQYDQAYFDRLASGELPDTDWYGLVLRNTAPQQQHNIAVSGGSEKTDYYINLGYTDQGSFFTTNSANYNRYNLRSNLNTQVTNNLKAGLKLNVIMDETNRQNTSTWEVFKQLWRSVPTDPLYANQTAPYYYHPDQEQNVVPMIHPELSGYIQNKKTLLQSNMNLEYTVPFVQGLKLKTMFSYDKTFNDNTTWRNEYKDYRYVAANDTYQSWNRNTPTSLNRTFDTSYSTLWLTQADYTRSFGFHNVSALLAYEERYNQNYGIRAFRQFSIPVPFLDSGNSDANQLATGGPLAEDASKSVIGRVNYDYAGRYMLELTIRSDASSRNAPAKRWGSFPSALAAWRLSEESFIKDNLPYVNNLKLRGSYGELGDDGSLQFQFVNGYDYPQTNGNRETYPKGYIFGNTFTNALGFRNAANPLITWMTSKIANVALDVDLWDGLLGVTGEIFQRDLEGELATPGVVVPGTFGSGLSQINYNASRTKGFEIELRHRHQIDDFRYNVTGFVSMTRNMATKRIQPERSNSYDYWRRNEVGRYTDIWFGNGANGQYTSFDQIAHSLYANAGTLPGDPIYEDWNGDGVIDDNDNHPIATTTHPNEDTNGQRNYPLMNFGATISGDWKGIDFSLLFQGSALSYVSYGEQLLNPLTWDGNALELLYDRWHPVDPDVDPYNPSNKWISGYYPYGKTRADTRSEFCIQDGSYLRLKSAEIGYTVPVKTSILAKSGIQRLRVFVNAYNLLTFTNVRGVDPEKPSELNGYLYPLNRTFNFGGSITF
ncbi:SusC/RagA family TonB-linked outer membrane protein [Bacteroidia bacterium]|nr:SusC/RagA family TonB-linked outer membrane protein [Bacteroidia bacterium]